MGSAYVDNPLPVSDWQVANQRALAAALSALRVRLEPIADKDHAIAIADAEAAEQQYRRLSQAMSPEPALETLCRCFGLSRFERATLLLCAGLELDSSFLAICAAAQGNPQHAYATFGFALASLPDAHWSALAPDAPLRHWRLVEFASGGSPGAPLTTRPLRIDERILHFLAGISHLEERLLGVERLFRAEELSPSHEVLAEQIAATCHQNVRVETVPAILLHGVDHRNIQAVAARGCELAGRELYQLSASSIPSGSAERNAFTRLWERESLLNGCVLLLDRHDIVQADIAQSSAVADFIETAKVKLIVSSRDRLRLRDRSRVEFEVSHPTSGEQRALWRTSLGDAADKLNGRIEMLSAQFSIPQSAILDIAKRACTHEEPDKLLNQLWSECRSQTRTKMDDLAQRIEGSAQWDDLVMPEAQKETLHEVVAHVRQRSKVYESWGFGHRGGRGLGISALFAGASGTGKTMAAEVLARELSLDLYRIDLSAVVSKYIGETEKNLRRLFDVAEEGGSILLFDEADSLFGKRSEVKDSHDRYANIEVSYLLQRMECYRGLAILTTNFRSALDTAFLRRIRFIVQFPFPDAAQRAEIWRRIFPSGTPTFGLEPQKLAQLNVAGGNIRNIALNSAFLAAHDDSQVRMNHVLRAARSEYAKLEKTLTDAEISGWE